MKLINIGFGNLVSARICACTVLSSDEVGSSSTISCGLTTSALAIAMR